MEESAILSNMATIITKDVLIDNCINNNYQKARKFPLLENDDEAFSFFLQQQQLLDRESRADVHENKELKRKQHKKRTSAKFATATSAETATLEEQGPTKKQTYSSPASGSGRSNIELNLLNEFEAIEFEGYLHMSKMTFLQVFRSMRHLFIEAASKLTPPQTVFSLSLWKLATDEHFEQIARKFKISITDCHAIIRQYWTLISDNYESFIKWPNSQQTQLQTLQAFHTHKELNAFRDLFGIVAIKRLDIFLENEDEEITVILQIICNADQKIIDCFVEPRQDYEFDSSPIGQTLALNSKTIPAHSYLIGDTHFPLKSYLMRPFENCIFERERAFNKMLEPALELARHVLNTMAQRFNTLYALEAHDLNEVRKIIETICSLHNLCVDIEDDYVERKREVIKFSWANVEDSLNIKTSEQNQEGVKRRLELLDSIAT